MCVCVSFGGFKRVGLVHVVVYMVELQGIISEKVLSSLRYERITVTIKRIDRFSNNKMLAIKPIK